MAQIGIKLKRVLIRLLTFLLVVGLLPTLPEAPPALAEDAWMSVGLDGADIQVLEGDDDSTEDLTIDLDNESVVLDEDVEEVSLDESPCVVQEEDSQENGHTFVESTLTDGQEPSGDELSLEVQFANVSNPCIEANADMVAGQVATWDCVWFGSYPQTEVTPNDLIYKSLQDASYDEK